MLLLVQLPTTFALVGTVAVWVNLAACASRLGTSAQSNVADFFIAMLNIVIIMVGSMLVYFAAYTAAR